MWFTKDKSSFQIHMPLLDTLFYWSAVFHLYLRIHQLKAFLYHEIRYNWLPQIYNMILPVSKKPFLLVFEPLSSLCIHSILLLCHFNPVIKLIVLTAKWMCTRILEEQCIPSFKGKQDQSISDRKNLENTTTCCGRIHSVTKQFKKY